MRDDDRESSRFFRTAVGAVEFCGSFRDLAHESCKKKVQVLKTHILLSTVTVHNTQPQMRTLRSGSRRDPRHVVTHSHNISSW